MHTYIHNINNMRGTHNAEPVVRISNKSIFEKNGEGVTPIPSWCNVSVLFVHKEYIELSIYNVFMVQIDIYG